MLNQIDYGSVLVGNGPAKRYSDKYEVNIKKAPDFFKRTLSPMTTTSSVVAVKFNGGVAVAADVGGYYGSMARFSSLERLIKVNNQIVMASNGDYADFQYMKDVIEQRSISEDILEDGYQMKAISLYTWLTRVMYSRRSKFDPLWNSIVVAGFSDGKSFLGAVDKLGLAYEDSCIATGMGSHLALPMLRDSVAKSGGVEKMTKDQAVAVLTKCLEVLYYRDCRSLPVFRVATVTSEGVNVSKEKELQSNWEIAHFVK
ncbi:proteasome subunit beta type-4 [Cimex lectularius]|uniref:Proteasome subunit beta n=1 Tax=Cimex lectularius TaxID=79782 RepID=A0A8I6RBY7_CIMLE|nr:proteasome subunit beta type-4 [Cimex lectularius]